MNPIHRTHRLSLTLAGLAAALLALTAAAPAAFARPLPPELVVGPTGNPLLPQTRTVTQTIVVGGMPGWQIALIAVGAALLAAVVTVLVDRARAAHRTAATSAA